MHEQIKHSVSRDALDSPVPAFNRQMRFSDTDHGAEYQQDNAAAAAADEDDYDIMMADDAAPASTSPKRRKHKRMSLGKVANTMLPGA
jgi:hypothetical protein